MTRTTADSREPAGGSRAIVVMAKQPQAGSTKTRLSPELSPEQAATVYEELLLATLTYVRARPDCTAIIAIDQPASADYFRSIAPAFEQVQQPAGSLGERLDSVLTDCLDRGFDAVFAISSDSPDLPSGHLDDAFAALDRDDVDVVLGPTEDGGYYLIGWKQRWSQIVTEVEMSTPSVLDDTLAVASRLHARVHLAPAWYDVDTPVDLARFREAERS